MKKVIYVSWTRLTDKYARDWYIDYLIENGMNVEYWDIVALTRENYGEVGELNVNYLRIIKSYVEFENLVQYGDNKDAIYIMLITPSWRTRAPFRVLSRYDRTMAYINWGGMPESFDPLIKRMVKKFSYKPFDFLRLLLENTAWYCYKKLKLIHSFDILFYAGSIFSQRKNNAKRLVSFNLCDYDHYIRAIGLSTHIVTGKYAVFLDINLPNQSDLALLNQQPVSPQEYYRSLNAFFSLLERKHNLKIVIAAHPKTHIDTATFARREVYRLVTAELVKDAQFVITHHSTALSYAVLNFKPCIFIYTNQMAEFYKNSIVRSIFAQASYLNSPVYNIDKINREEQVVLSEPNAIRYEKYKYNFLTSKESENLNSKDLFLNEIKIFNDLN